jgi:hypothetical protein
VAEERLPPEDHVELAGFRVETDVRSRPAGADEAAVAGSGGVRVDQGAGGRAHPVGTDEHVRGRVAAVGEPGEDAVGVLLDADEAPAVADVDAALPRRGAQRGVEGGAGGGDADGAVGERGAGGLGSEVGAVAEPEHAARGRDAPVADGAVRVEFGERGHAVDRQPQAGPDVVGGGVVGLEDGGVDSDVLQGQGGGGAGHPGPDDQCAGHVRLRCAMQVDNFHRK